jgi:hypothetical protein
VVDPNELFGVDGVIIHVERHRLELVRLGNLPELGCQVTKRVPPEWSGGSHMRAPARGGGRRPCPVTSYVVNDVAEVSWIVIIFALPMVLSYPLMSIIVS